MIHLWHPRKEIDIWVVEDEEEYDIALDQGYLSLDMIRKRADPKVYKLMKETKYQVANEKVNYAALPVAAAHRRSTPTRNRLQITGDE